MVVVVGIATATTATTMAAVTRQRNGIAMALVMDRNGQCNGNATVRMVMEGATAIQRRCDGHRQRNSNCDTWSNGNTKAMTVMDGATATGTAMVMDGTMATAMEGGTETQRRQ